MNVALSYFSIKVSANLHQKGGISAATFFGGCVHLFYSVIGPFDWPAHIYLNIIRVMLVKDQLLS